MAEYIDREKTLKAVCPYEDGGYFQEVNVLLKCIESVPAADVAPVVHGHWVLEAEKGTCMDFHVKAHCSECGHKWFGKNGVGNYSYVFSAFVRGPDEDAIAFVLREASGIKIDRFCSACGAKMDKEATDGD